MKPLQNRRAVITGAASGIGAAIAYAYADAGASLCCVIETPSAWLSLLTTVVTVASW